MKLHHPKLIIVQLSIKYLSFVRDSGDISNELMLLYSKMHDKTNEVKDFVHRAIDDALKYGKINVNN